ncbi:UPF0149 family protein [Salipiger marinus]|uniref:UPF0149 family protein n=1 Tax=Salipiger marinus TaxID=555512 RepID=UPI002C53F6B0|nr:UPF0149 family protein [Salipiger manganoxidans]MEB3422105.1 UPF0149 family protein [Salipiger manganoxidans]
MNTSTPTSAPKRLMLDEKDFFDVLRARRPSPPAADPQALDGYLTALIIGPRFIGPRQWIPAFVGEDALMAPEHTTEAKALQSLVAAYNTISSGLGDTPEIWRPRLAARGDAAHAPYLWASGFLLATKFAPRLWQPILQGAESDLIGPIREMADPRANLNAPAVAKVAKAVIAIRAHFMPRRAKSFR